MSSQEKQWHTGNKKYSENIPRKFSKRRQKMLCQPKVEGIDVEKENKLDRAILSFQKVEFQLLLESRFLRVFSKVS